MRNHSVSLAETLDRVLNKGAVVAGDIIISVAGIDLLYLGANLTLSSVETMRRLAAEKRSAPIQTTGGGLVRAIPQPGNGDGSASPKESGVLRTGAPRDVARGEV